MAKIIYIKSDQTNMAKSAFVIRPSSKIYNKDKIFYKFFLILFGDTTNQWCAWW